MGLSRNRISRGAQLKLALARAEKAVVFLLRNLISPFSPLLCTRLMVWYFRRHGMRIGRSPNYLSAHIWFDGTDYSLIELGEGCTISSFVRVLTHDWSIYTVARAIALTVDRPIGIFRSVKVGRYAFIGTGSILMPGSEVGEGAVVGAGTVIRGRVLPFAIVAGSPARVVGDSRELLLRELRRQQRTEMVREAEERIRALMVTHPSAPKDES